MMEHKRYATAADFRRALEDRLQDIARKKSFDLQRLRRQVAFDRLLARLFQVGEPLALPWVLKGGYAMELRIKAARTTKDTSLKSGILLPAELEFSQRHRFHKTLLRAKKGKGVQVMRIEQSQNVQALRRWNIEFPEKILAAF